LETPFGKSGCPTSPYYALVLTSRINEKAYPKPFYNIPWNLYRVTLFLQKQDGKRLEKEKRKLAYVKKTYS